MNSLLTVCFTSSVLIQDRLCLIKSVNFFPEYLKLVIFSYTMILHGVGDHGLSTDSFLLLSVNGCGLLGNIVSRFISYGFPFRSCPSVGLAVFQSIQSHMHNLNILWMFL